MGGSDVLVDQTLICEASRLLSGSRAPAVERLRTEFAPLRAALGRLVADSGRATSLGALRAARQRLARVSESLRGTSGRSTAAAVDRAIDIAREYGRHLRRFATYGPARRPATLRDAGSGPP